LRPT